MAMDNFSPFTLDRYLGTLMNIWVVPLLDGNLTPPPRLPESMTQLHSELDKGPIPFGTYFPNLYPRQRNKRRKVHGDIDRQQ